MTIFLNDTPSKSRHNRKLWVRFYIILKNLCENDLAAKNLSNLNRESRAYGTLDARVSALSDALHSDLASMTELVSDAADERAALLACTAQFVQAEGFNGTPEVARAIHVLARSAANDVSDRELQAALIWLLDRVDPARAFCAGADVDDDAPGVGPKGSL